MQNQKMKMAADNAQVLARLAFLKAMTVGELKSKLPVKVAPLKFSRLPL